MKLYSMREIVSLLRFMKGCASMTFCQNRNKAKIDQIKDLKKALCQTVPGCLIKPVESQNTITDHWPHFRFSYYKAIHSSLQCLHVKTKVYDEVFWRNHETHSRCLHALHMIPFNLWLKLFYQSLWIIKNYGLTVWN